MRTLVRTLIAAVMLAAAAPSAQANPLYTPRFLPGFEATDLNNRGEVVGTPPFSGVPLLWRDGELFRLPTPGSYTLPTAINDRGDIAGWVRLGGGRGETAILWVNRTERVLQSLGGRHAQAFDINDPGVAVGWSEYAPRRRHRHPVLWRGEQPVDLGTLGGRDGFALAINDAGAVVGTAMNANEGYRAFLWRDGTMVELAMLRSPGPHALHTSYAAAINDRGDIVGVDSPDDFQTRAVIWKQRRVEALETASGWYSEVWGISNSGVIVGWEWEPGRAGRRRPVIWVQEQRFTLNSLLPPGGPRMEGIVAVNDRGSILAARLNPPGAGTYVLAPATCHGRQPTITGTHGEDVLRGTPGADVVVAGAGDDRIRTGGGRDLVCAGGGDDWISGGGAIDILLGERGADEIHAEQGADGIRGGRGNDRLYGDRDDDALDGGRGRDRLVASAGADSLDGGDHRDVCLGGADDDTAANCEITGGVP
jgi:probable HAF family extracellular repeat protein